MYDRLQTRMLPTTLLLSVITAVGIATQPASATESLGWAASVMTPSGNIQCAIDEAWAMCQVKEGAWGAPPPRNCDLDWISREVSLWRGGVHVGQCRGDAPLVCPYLCRMLPYGTSISVGRVRCDSRTTGLTCRMRNGRGIGFTISRERFTRIRAGR